MTDQAGRQSARAICRHATIVTVKLRDLNVDVELGEIAIQNAVHVERWCCRKVCGDQWVPRPIQEASREAMMLRYRQALPVVHRQIRVETYCLLALRIEPAKISASVVRRPSRGRQERPLDIRLATIAPSASTERTVAA